MLRGCHPDQPYPQASSATRTTREDRRNHRLAGPWRAAFAGCKGDLPWMRLALRQPRNFGCNLPASQLTRLPRECAQNCADTDVDTFNGDFGNLRLCPLCLASKLDEENLFTVVAADAPHVGTLESHWEWEASASRRSVLTKMPGWRHERVFFDPMHTIHLGVGMDAVGSSMLILAQRGWYGSCSDDLDVRLGRCWAQFRLWCRKQRVTTSIPRFSRKTSGPMLLTLASPKPCTRMARAGFLTCGTLCRCAPEAWSQQHAEHLSGCLLYTSDAADDLTRVLL